MIETNSTLVQKPKRHKRISFLKTTATILIMGGVFYLGILVGQGTIVFGSDAVYKKSVQKDLPANLNYESTEEVYDKLKSGFDGQLDLTKLQDGIKEGLVKAAGDPFTEYLNKEAAKEFNDELNGSFEGIGAELSKDKDTLIIVSPIGGSPAEKAGLKPRDAIVEINGESAYDLTVSEAVKKIRGPKDSKVTLKIVRAGQPLTVEIVRGTIVIPSVTSETADGNIGVMKVVRFDETTGDLALAAAQKFKAAKVRGVILDLRGNPGGTLSASVDLSSLWLKDKVVLEERRNAISTRTYKSHGEPILLNIPTIVLINEGSASASEITAGALHDNQAATIYGTKSFGKGSVQELLPLKFGGVLKLTIAHWYTPGGRNIDKEGIEPDKKVELTEDDANNKRDPQKDAALEFLKK